MLIPDFLELSLRAHWSRIGILNAISGLSRVASESTLGPHLDPNSTSVLSVVVSGDTLRLHLDLNANSRFSGVASGGLLGTYVDTKANAGLSGVVFGGVPRPHLDPNANATPDFLETFLGALWDREEVNPRPVRIQCLILACWSFKLAV